MGEDFFEACSKITGTDAGELRQLAMEIQDNHRTLLACPGHDFQLDIPDDWTFFVEHGVSYYKTGTGRFIIPGDEPYRCNNCKGTVAKKRIPQYQKGGV